MTKEQIIKIAKGILENDDYDSKVTKDSVLDVIEYALNDPRSVNNGMDLQDDVRRFGNVLGFVDARVDKRQAELVNHIHEIVVNIAILEGQGIVKVL